jgi:hypothetical protein
MHFILLFYQTFGLGSLTNYVDFFLNERTRWNTLISILVRVR